MNKLVLKINHFVVEGQLMFECDKTRTDTAAVAVLGQDQVPFPAQESD